MPQEGDRGWYRRSVAGGWVLTFTLHISNDGWRIFTRTLATDGTTRLVLLEGEYVPAPGAFALLAMGDLAASRRRR